MIEIKPGDYVLMENQFLYDTLVIRQVVTVKKLQVLVRDLRQDEDEPPSRRLRKAVRAVFADLAAVERFQAVHKDLLAHQQETSRTALSTYNRSAVLLARATTAKEFAEARVKLILAERAVLAARDDALGLELFTLTMQLKALEGL